MIFIIRHSSFSIFLKIPDGKILIFCDRSFAWFVNYFFAKFLEILTTRSLEIGKFLQKQSVLIFRTTVHALHLTGFFRCCFRNSCARAESHQQELAKTVFGHLKQLDNELEISIM